MVIGIGLGVFLCGKWRVYEAVTAEVVTDFFFSSAQQGERTTLKKNHGDRVRFPSVRTT
jgi:hypothetical protein